VAETNRTNPVAGLYYPYMTLGQIGLSGTGVHIEKQGASPIFDNTATIVILANSMIMIISSSGSTPDWTYYTDRIFQAFYTSEVILKMVG
jgi:hypothetical protein